MRFLPLFSTVFGAMLVIQAHEGILDEALELPPPRGGWGPEGPRFTTSASPNFWIYASALYAWGAVVSLTGAIYLTTGNRFLPSFRTEAWFVLLLFGAGCALWSICFEFLPGAYA